MSIVVPSGNKMVEWLPKSESDKMEKTASTQASAEQAPTDFLLEAARQFLSKKAQVVEVVAPSDSVTSVPSVTEPAPVVDAAPSSTPALPMEGEKPLSEEKPADPNATKEEAAIAKVEEAVNTLQTAVQEAKETVTECKEEGAPAPADEKKDEFPKSDEDKDKKDDFVEVEIPDSNVVESKKDCEDKSGEDCGKVEAAAGVNKVVQATVEDKLQSWASLSPEVRKKYVSFWSKIWPKDYVALFVKE